MIRDEIARFIEGEGHRVEVSPVDEERALAEIVFRTRGQMFSVAVSEMDPQTLRISTAYEIPTWVGDRHHALSALGDIELEYPEAHFMLAHDDSIFIATVDYEAKDTPAFLGHFWEIVGRLREAGTTAIERMVDRSESKAAAEKFISQFMKGQR